MTAQLVVVTIAAVRTDGSGFKASDGRWFSLAPDLPRPMLQLIRRGATLDLAVAGDIVRKIQPHQDTPPVAGGPTAPASSKSVQHSIDRTLPELTTRQILDRQMRAAALVAAATWCSTQGGDVIPQAEEWLKWLQR